MRLLALVRERTEHALEPVDVAELAAACRLSASEAEAAWRYLRDHRLINTFSIPLTARINAKGIDALDSATVVHFEQGSPKEGAATARGYGRVDSPEALDRAREVPKELDRLHAFLPELTDSELSAYSTRSLPIGTILQSKGKTFSVLTEDMRAQAVRNEVDRRKANGASMNATTEPTADRWIRALRNNKIIAAIVVVAVIVIGIGAVAEALKHVKDWFGASPEPPPAQREVVKVQSATAPPIVPLTASVRVESDSLRPTENGATNHPEPAVATAFALQMENDGSVPEERIRVHVSLAGIVRFSSTALTILPVPEWDPINTAGFASPAKSVTKDYANNQINYGWTIPVLAPHQKARYRIWYHKPGVFAGRTHFLTTALLKSIHPDH